ncbi:hypothetical protein CIHG_00321 [Coccidioides immitis H538.4]|uniref:Uncharacterized protein n=3 Tax=Coccidioides TaxID=5500 RepID=A0A0J8RBF0_COCIT|nr:hypothetical protein CPAG_08888 [Coccidioides posadasii RMSCC 3488]KMP07461.1 hypothetical protein CIRG_07141 [Coccidioides immitis RMSCC 2394]KMU82540.1 hypothetical protein CIHG_00321 [Coccidioides immitis H538.4]TPX19405.1 hypothetical protein DIZ76_017194 [Coccidioides immitis]
MFIIGGAWTCLIGFLVLGICRQKYTRTGSPSVSMNKSRDGLDLLPNGHLHGSHGIDAKAGAPKNA